MFFSNLFPNSTGDGRKQELTRFNKPARVSLLAGGKKLNHRDYSQLLVTSQ
jgi:hypothetical protein